MEYLLANRSFMPLAEFLFGIFVLCTCVTLKKKLADNIRDVLEGLGWDILITLPPGC